MWNPQRAIVNWDAGLSPLKESLGAHRIIRQSTCRLLSSHRKSPGEPSPGLRSSPSQSRLPGRAVHRRIPT
jgi:hypothetical protein